MKTKNVIKHTLLMLTIALGILSCSKKDGGDTPTPVAPNPAQVINFTDLKALSTGASVKVPDAKKISGIVISDASGKNIGDKTVILQEATDKPGIIVNFVDAQTFALNDQVEIDISNQTLAQVNGEVVLNNIPNANAKKTGTGSITPKTVTSADIIANKTALDGTLVIVAATGLTGESGKYAGTLTITDASGTITSNVLAGATFTSSDLPPSVTSITGIVRISDSNARIDIRKMADVVTGAITHTITEMFENVRGLGDDPTKIRSGFTTSLGNWSGYYGPNPTYQTAFPEDASFTTAGRKYLYQWLTTEGIDQPFPLTCAFTNLKGLKTVSVTFAGSKSLAPWIIDNNGHEDTYAIKAFDPAKDYIQIGIAPADYAAPLFENSIKKSEKFTKIGEFYTYTWTVPTKEELVVGGVSPEQADQYLKNPVFFIYNYSSSRGPSGIPLSAIVYDKVVFSFSN